MRRYPCLTAALAVGLNIQYTYGVTWWPETEEMIAVHAIPWIIFPILNLIDVAQSEGQASKYNYFTEKS